MYALNISNVLLDLYGAFFYGTFGYTKIHSYLRVEFHYSVYLWLNCYYVIGDSG